MASDSLAERNPAFNQLSPSSVSLDAAFQASETLAKFELADTLLAKAEALSAIALLGGWINDCVPLHRQHYLAVLDELIVSAREQQRDALARVRAETAED